MINEFRTQFDAAIKQWLDVKRTAYLASQAADPLFFDVFNMIESLSLSGGKRARPYIAALMYQAVAKKEIQDIRPLIGIEMLQLFCLIHDDIMDEADTRRGVATVHASVHDAYIKSKRKGNLVRASESQAMLAGDLVYSWAHELFDTSTYSPAVCTRVKQLFHTMSEEVVIGQMIDVDLMTTARTQKERIIKKMRFKTASYTFVNPMKIGAALAGGDASYMQFADTFGAALGIAYQIQDDLLDVFGDEAITGKTPMRDIAEGQHTLITQYVFDHGSDADIQLLERYMYTKDIDADGITELREMFERSGAAEATKEAARMYFETARTALDAISLPEDIQEAFVSLIALFSTRNA